MSAVTAAPSSEIDPFSTAFFEDPHSAHHALREAGPVVWLAQYGVWAVARYAEVHAMLHDWQTFSSARGVGIQDLAKEKAIRLPSPILETDPPQHDRARAVLNKVLSAGAMRGLRPRFAAEADALINTLLDAGQVDAIPQLAEAYPLTVFPDAVGMPKENRHYLLPYGSMVFNSFGPANSILAEATKDAAVVFDWVLRQSQRDALAPVGFGADIHAAADRGELTAEEAPMVVRGVLTAGVDTTVNGIGAAVYCLARYPEQFQRLRAEPAMVRAAFEEAVRYESPVQTFFRTTTRPTEIGGVALPEGAKVLMFLGSANRDPRRFDNPADYDITRKVAGHVGFGSGIHECVGQALARMEGEAVLSALARLVERIEICGPVRRRYNNTLRGLESLPIRLHRAH